MATLSNNLGAKGVEKGQFQYICNYCDFNCCKKYSWERHILTSKHKKSTDSNISATENGQKGAKKPDIKAYSCENCGKEYTDRTGLWRHKQKCSDNIYENKKLNDLDKDDLIKTLIEQNAKLMSILENGTHNNNNNNTTHTNSHNKAFNLNFFFNDYF